MCSTFVFHYRRCIVIVNFGGDMEVEQQFGKGIELAIKLLQLGVGVFFPRFTE